MSAVSDGRTRCANTDETYRHDRIQADQCIRLFQFVKDDTSDDIRIRIKIVRLDDRPVYQSLSYCWGDYNDRRPVWCKRRVIWITVNLFDALKRIKALYQESESQWFWADQICINQLDVEEKAEQVPRMGWIFQGAANVIIWLGDEDEAMYQFFDILEAYRAAMYKEDFDFRIAQLGRELEEQYRSLREVGQPPNLHHPIAKFFSNDWFKRVWTFQEIWVPQHKSHFIICGLRTFLWAHFCDALAYIYGSTNDTTVFLRESGLHVHLMIANYRSYPKSWNLSRLVLGTAARSASDSRDHIYALLGIMSQQGTIYPKPDYSSNRSNLKVFAQYARAIILQEKDLEILLMLKARLPSVDRPSWILDFENRPRDSMPFSGRQNFPEDMASRGLAADVVETDSTTDNMLVLNGLNRTFRIAKLLSLEDLRQSLSGTTSRFADVVRSVNVLVECNNLATKYASTGESTAAAILKTIALNDSDYGCPDEKHPDLLDNMATKLHLAYLQESIRRSKALAEADERNGYECQPHGEVDSWTKESILELVQREFNFDTACSSGGVAALTPVEQIRSDADWILDLLDDSVTSDYYSRVRLLESQQLVVTDNGLFAVVPHFAHPGDEICVLLGGRVPLVLRGVEGSTEHRLIGPSYVHGINNVSGILEYEAHCNSSPTADRRTGLRLFALV